MGFPSCDPVRFTAKSILVVALASTSSALAQDATFQGLATKEWIALLRDRDERVWDQAMRALGVIGKQTVPELTKLLDDKDEQVRWKAARIMKGWDLGESYEKAVPKLIAMAFDETSYLCRGEGRSVLASLMKDSRLRTEHCETLRDAALKSIRGKGIVQTPERVYGGVSAPNNVDLLILTGTTTQADVRKELCSRVLPELITATNEKPAPPQKPVARKPGGRTPVSKPVDENARVEYGCIPVPAPGFLS